MAYDNNMSGIIKRNPNPSSEKSPPYRGFCEIDGVEYWISAWVNTKEDTGESYFKLRFTEKEQQQAPQRQPQRRQQVGGPPFDDDIPF